MFNNLNIEAKMVSYFNAIYCADEIDSYMYQSVGHHGIDMYAEAMGLPLYRRTITGSALVTSKHYGKHPGDEVEDLFLLLQDIQVLLMLYAWFVQTLESLESLGIKMLKFPGLDYSTFTALTLLLWQREGHLVCKKTEWWDAGMVVCLGHGADLYMDRLMPLPLTVSCSSQSRLDLPSWFYVSGASSPR